MLNNFSILHDSPIRFPGLFGDWEFTASGSIQLGRFSLHWYGILITLGLLLASRYCMKHKEQYGIREDDFLDCLIWGIPSGIVGARIYYVLFYLDLFRSSDGTFQWGKAIAIWDGGLAIYGTVIAIVVVAILICKSKKIAFFALMDFFVPGLLIGQCVGRWGNFMNREAFGGLTELPWRMELTTNYGRQVCVHPTFLYESLWTFIGFLLIALIVSKSRHFDGENTWFYFLWYGFGRFWIEGLRADSLYLFNWTIFGEPIRVSQALSLVMVIVAAFMLVYHLILHPHTAEELFVNKSKAEETAENISESADAQTMPNENIEK